MQAGIVYWFGVDLVTSAFDGGVSAALLAVSCLLISNIFRFHQPTERRYLYILAPGIILAALVTWTESYLLHEQTYCKLLLISIYLLPQ